MATIRVSGQSQLDSALNSVNAGDELVLTGGNYGSLDLTSRWQSSTKQSGSLSISSADPGNPAVFSSVNATNVSNVSFNGVKFQDGGTSKAFLFTQVSNISIQNSDFVGGGGSSHGLWVRDASNFTLSNSDISNYNTGGWFLGVQNLQIIGNDLNGIELDGLMLGDVSNLLVSGNSIEMNRQDVAHKDLIQLWATTTIGTSNNIVIRNNQLSADDNTSHGIYMGNDAARSTGNAQYFWQDVLIENNTVRSGQALGIAIGESNGLDIRNNVVVQHAGQDSSRPVNVPAILVQTASRDVTITGNTSHKEPSAAGANFQVNDNGGGGWTISNNRIVPLGSDVGGAPDSDGDDDDDDGDGGTPGTPPADGGDDDDGGDGGDGSADRFFFNGSNLSSDRQVTFGVNFSEGDEIVLSNFDRGTFDHIRGANDLDVNDAGTYALLDSLTDVRELGFASGDVITRLRGEDLILEIEQGADELTIVMPDLADRYDSLF